MKSASLVIAIMLCSLSAFAGVYTCDAFNDTFGKIDFFTAGPNAIDHISDNHWGKFGVSFSCTYEQQTSGYRSQNPLTYWCWSLSNAYDQLGSTCNANNCYEGNYKNYFTSHKTGINTLTYQGNEQNGSTSYWVGGFSVNGCFLGDIGCGYIPIGFSYPNGVTFDTIYHEGSLGRALFTQPETDSYACPYEWISTYSPIVVRLDGGHDYSNAFTSVENGIFWTFLPNNPAMQIAWTADSNFGFLALDKNSDGVINDSAELFGTYSRQFFTDEEIAKNISDGKKAEAEGRIPKELKTNGFRALMYYDQINNGGNGDGVLDASDAIWPKLLMCKFPAPNPDFTVANSCKPLSAYGITEISLKFVEIPKKDQYGNLLRWKGTLTMNSLKVPIYDVEFVTK